jgi:hypothetical protein
LFRLRIRNEAFNHKPLNSRINRHLNRKAATAKFLGPNQQLGFIVSSTGLRALDWLKCQELGPPTM